MGSKRIKAIAIRGTHPITVADPEGLLRETLKLIQVSQGPGTQKYRILGTPSNVLNMNKMGVLPTRNFSGDGLRARRGSQRRVHARSLHREGRGLLRLFHRLRAVGGGARGQVQGGHRRPGL